MNNRTRAIRREIAAIVVLGGAIVSATTHALLTRLDSHGLLGTSYSTHGHLASFDLGACLLVAASLLVRQGWVALRRSTFADQFRALCTKITTLPVPQTAGVIFFIAAAMLIFQEMMEQIFLGGHFDGVISAFGDVPMIGIAGMLVLSFATTLLLQGAARIVAAIEIAFTLRLRFLRGRFCTTLFVARDFSTVVHAVHAALCSRIPKRGPPIAVLA